MNQLVYRLNQAKKKKQFTLKKLAEVSGLSQGTVNKIMGGELKSVRPDKLSRLAAALDVSEEWLHSPLTAEEVGTPYLGMVKIACVSPEVKVGNCAFNAEQVIKSVQHAAHRGVQIAVLPELCLTGYSCGDLFFQDALQSGAVDALLKVRDALTQTDTVAIVGLPLMGNDGRLYNVGAVLLHGRILGVIPKKNLPNYNEFMEKRYFCAYNGANTTVTIDGKQVPFGVKLLFNNTLHPEMRFAVEICEDVWVADSPSIRHAAAGANCVVNLSASNETVVKAAYRKKMLEIQSAKCGVIYAYSSAGPSESTSATVFSAHNIIAENGECLAEAKPFGSGYAEAVADFDFIQNERARLDRGVTPDGYQTVNFELKLQSALRKYSAHPFVPQNVGELNDVCSTAMKILAHGLQKRMEHIGASKLVVGVSGGSDSTLALLICRQALELCGRDSSDIVGVTMPCFGTSKRTLGNSLKLMRALGCTQRQIDISAAVTQHLQDIGHDLTTADATFENAQARERTQVLMDVANSCNGLVVGTGDMSEAALGWCTFNGDQMSMYAALASVPKTLVKAMIHWCEKTSGGELAEVLHDVLATPVSPELLPTDAQGNIAQITENSVGPYELHDYFMFMLLRKGFTPGKVLWLAKESFRQKYDEATLRKWLQFFIRRFFAQQFKRSCTPDSVRLGSVDLSKYSMRLPSDADPTTWLAELDHVLQ